jgi:hypothetical protein
MRMWVTLLSNCRNFCPFLSDRVTGLPFTFLIPIQKSILYSAIDFQQTCHIFSSRIVWQVPLTDTLSHLLTFFCPSAKTNVASLLERSKFYYVPLLVHYPSILLVLRYQEEKHVIVQILCFWTLSIVLSLSKNRPVYFSKHNVSETGFCLCLPEDGDRITYTKRCFEK